MDLQFDDVIRYGGLLLQGAVFSVLVSIAAGLVGLTLAILFAEGQRRYGGILRFVIRAYVEFIRNTPFIVQLFFIFFGLPSMGLRIDANTAAFIALTLNVGAYFTEIVRGGLETTQKGQYEAGMALGLKRGQVFWYVVLRPAMAKIWPSLVSQFVLVFLGSAAMSQISAEDLTFAGQFIQSRTFRAFEVYILITLIYAGLALALRSMLLLAARRLFPWTRNAR